MSTFRPPDLRNLELLLDQATAVVPMEDIADGLADDRTIGLRHDCDNEIATAVRMAEWEAERGYRSTYYILHTAGYWRDKAVLDAALERIVGCGHALGIHNDALTVAIETGRDPADVLYEVTEELRGYGHEVRSTVAHGNGLCGVHNYVNDELFVECRREAYGDIGRLGFTPVSLAEFGLDFDANWLPRGDYLSESGGQWSQPFVDVAAAFPNKGQLHMLVHPCHWEAAFEASVGEQVGAAFGRGIKEALT